MRILVSGFYIITYSSYNVGASYDLAFYLCSSDGTMIGFMDWGRDSVVSMSYLNAGQFLSLTLIHAGGQSPVQIPVGYVKVLRVM